MVRAKWLTEYSSVVLYCNIWNLDFFHCNPTLLNTIPPPTHRSIQAVQIEYSKLTFGTLRVLLQSQADLESAL